MLLRWKWSLFCVDQGFWRNTRESKWWHSLIVCKVKRSSSVQPDAHCMIYDRTPRSQPRHTGASHSSSLSDSTTINARFRLHEFSTILPRFAWRRVWRWASGRKIPAFQLVWRVIVDDNRFCVCDASRHHDRETRMFNFIHIADVDQ